MKLEDDAYLTLFLQDTLYHSPNKATAAPESAAAEEPAPKAEEPSPAPAAEVAEPVAEAKNYPPMEWLGENKGGVVLLVHYPEEQYLPTAHRELLGKILLAVKLDWPQVALVNLAKTPADHPELAALQSAKVVSFQTNHPWVAGASPYQQTEMQGRTVLQAEALGAIAEDRNKKAQLWGALQQLFPS